MKEAVEDLVILNDELLEAFFKYVEANKQASGVREEITEHLNASMRLIRDLE
jgi:hypothetical protein